MISHKFFFYNKMKDINNLEKVSKRYNIEEAYIFISNIDLKTNTIILNEKNNKKLHGKYVDFFEKDLSEIVMRINNLFEKDYCKNNLIRYKKFNKFFKKYHYLRRVMEYTPKNFFYKRYRIVKVPCYLKKKSLLVNLII